MTSLIPTWLNQYVLKLRDLLAEKRAIEAEIAKRQETLRAVELLISRIRERDGLPPEESPSFSLSDTNGDEKQARTRGTLKAAKQSLHYLVQFTKSDLLKRIEEINPALLGRVKPEAFRLTLRTLVKEGFITPTEHISPETGEAIYRRVREV